MEPILAAQKLRQAPDYLPCVFLSSAIPMPKGNPEAVFSGLTAGEHAQYEAEFAYLRGDFRPILVYANTVSAEAPTYVCACAIAMSAAISTGDYPAFTAAFSRLERIKTLYPGTKAALYADAALATAAVSMYAPEHAPDWLQKGDFSMFPPAGRPWLAYLHAKYLLDKKDYAATHAAAQAALSLLTRENSISTAALYLRLMCAAACHGAGADERAAAYLSAALAIAMPHGFVTPFAETVTAYGGLLEKCLLRDWPGQYGAIAGQPESAWKNWISFHNQFTKDNITLVLTLREYRLARMLAEGATYAQAAKRLNLSVGRIRNIASAIYGKLYIKGKAELKSFIL